MVGLLLVFLLASVELSACINEYRTRADGSLAYTERRHVIVPSPPLNSLELQQQADSLLRIYEKTGMFHYLSDYGAALIYLGRYEEAETIYRHIEAWRPGLYTTASNLGTLFELTGRIDSALFWITRSVAINPGSHKGSEWIHIKILEYKLRNAGESTQLSTSLLGLDFGNDEEPMNKNRYNLDSLQTHLIHQLHERTKFVKPKDDIVGSLYFDLGNILTLTESVEDGMEAYTKAEEYGFTSPLLEKRIGAFWPLTIRSTLLNLLDNARVQMSLTFLAIAVGIGVIIMIRRRRKKQIINQSTGSDNTDIM